MSVAQGRSVGKYGFLAGIAAGQLSRLVKGSVAQLVGNSIHVMFCNSRALMLYRR